MMITPEIERIAADLQLRINRNEEELKTLPDARLSWTMKDGKRRAVSCRYEDGKRKRKDVTSDREMIMKLLRAEILRDETGVLQKDLDCLTEMVAVLEDWSESRCFADLVRKYEGLDAGLIEKAVYRSDAVHDEWADEPYNRSNIFPEKLIHSTSRGLKVRSKNELMIAEKLYDRSLSFRYEEIIDVGGGMSLVPDFSIKRADGEIIYWEHFGMMDDRKYRENMLWKLEQYDHAGIIPGRNLILTYSEGDQKLDVRVIESAINNYLVS